MKKMIICFIALMILFTMGCNINIFNSKKWEYDIPKISIHRGTMKEEIDNYKGQIPKFTYDGDGSTYSGPVFLTGQDLRNFDLSNNMNELIHSIFDTKTLWPEKLPSGFDPEKAMELGKNPGLGIRNLNKQGITGRSVSIAIIGESLYVDHIEYSERIKLYEEIGIMKGQGGMESSIIVSSICGKTTGIAPEADVFYIAAPYREIMENGDFTEDYMGTAMGIDRVIEINKTLPKNRKIKLLYTWGVWRPGGKNELEYSEAVQRAIKEDITVVTTTGIINGRVENRFDGAGRNPMISSDDRNAYGMSTQIENLWHMDNMDAGKFMSRSHISTGTLLVPAEPRTYAFPTGQNEYLYYCQEYFPSTFIAGLLTLGFQIDSSLKPQDFVKGLADTSEPLYVNVSSSEPINIGRLINPEKLFQTLQSK